MEIARVPAKVVVDSGAAEEGEAHAVAVRLAELDRLLQVGQGLVGPTERRERLRQAEISSHHHHHQHS